VSVLDAWVELGPIVTVTNDAESVAVAACVLDTENGQQSSFPFTHPTIPRYRSAVGPATTVKYGVAQ
jgi:hypothetical protein